MNKLKKETTAIQHKLQIERKKHKNDRRSEQLLLQERYENLMHAAERDRVALETQMTALSTDNHRLKSLVAIAQEKEQHMSRELLQQQQQQQQQHIRNTMEAVAVAGHRKQQTAETAAFAAVEQQNRVLLQQNQVLQEQLQVRMWKSKR